jgi:hypothetical protein
VDPLPALNCACLLPSRASCLYSPGCHVAVASARASASNRWQHHGDGVAEEQQLSQGGQHKHRQCPGVKQVGGCNQCGAQAWSTLVQLPCDSTPNPRLQTGAVAPSPLQSGVEGHSVEQLLETLAEVTPHLSFSKGPAQLSSAPYVMLCMMTIFACCHRRLQGSSIRGASPTRVPRRQSVTRVAPTMVRPVRAKHPQARPTSMSP